MTKHKQDIALVLSGGGARGMAHIGVIEVLKEKGYHISSIAGTSIGSLVGGVYVSGKMEPFKEWMAHMGKMDMFRLMDLVISKNGIIRGEKVFKEMEQFISDANIEDLEIPYAAVAVDVRNHKEVVFRKGKLVDAIRASVSIPTIFKPFTYNGQELVDGGVLNPLPLDCVKRKEGDLLLAVDLNADVPYDLPQHNSEQESSNQTYVKALEFINEKWSKYFRNGKNKTSGFFELITLSVYAMQVKLTEIAIEKHKPDVVIDISKTSCDIFEFQRSEELIQYGRKQTEKAINDQILKD
ncbi:MAG: patatin-like phospholipase family protein [Bacteroidetes bacterium]|nr:patatin-like phospholipase family protein [Bacteroidota bacterium]